MKHLSIRTILLLIFSLLLVACGSATSLINPLNQQSIVETSNTRDVISSELELAPSAQAIPQSERMPVVSYNSSNSPTAAVTGLEDALITVYQQANPAVAYIIIPSVGAGSGFVYSQDGHIVTNYHVVSGLNSAEVLFSNGERRRGQVVGTDLDSDLAVIKVNELPSGIHPLPLAASDVKVGQFVVAIGSPFGENGSMSFGIVSAVGRSLESQREFASGSNYSLPQVIQTDAAINPGNSGGPLLNLNGEVVGVNAAIATTSSALANSGVGFSIPVAAVHQVVPSLIEHGRHTYPYIGIGFDDEVSLDEQPIYGLTQTQGAYVLRVSPNGPAAKAGLQAANSTTGRGGDLIIALNNHPVNNFTDLNSYLIFNTDAKETIRITLLRNGRELTIPLTLGERPS